MARAADMHTVSELIIDGHVHVHPSFDERAFLLAVCQNLSRHGTGMPTIFLAEMSGIRAFARWRSGNAPWKVTLTDESVSLILDDKLLVIAGRQIATAERLEIVALFSDGDFHDGESFEATLTSVKKSGALPVLPWGVGKWSGSRGELIAQAARSGGVLLGDNAGRPIGWPAPQLFRSQVVLPGTDPLRMRSEQQIVGTYGFRLPGPIDLSKPAASIRRTLSQLSRSPEAFGSRVGPLTFVRQQAGLRLSK